LLDDQAAVLDLQQAAALSDGTRFRRRDAELEPQRCGTGGNDLAGDVRVCCEGRNTSTNPTCSIKLASTM
jgi:hypothetical protein